MASALSALSYKEPDIETILILTSFILLLNVVNHALDNAIYCGLIGQIFIGVGWGAPGTGWLSTATQKTVVQLGYLGLILIVYEGGLSTSVTALRANLFLSGLVACIGISAPIALSFILQTILGITPLQAFAAGAALCSTSLGTTFTVLSTSGLTKSRLGVILTSAAMMDDVIGLVMVQVISTLGQTSAIFDAVTVVRPICVSVAFAIIIPLLCKFIVKPLTVWWYRCRFAANSSLMGLNARYAMFMLHTGVVVAFVTGSTYAGTSNLFAAYLAGACITWWDRVCAELSTTLHDTAEPAPPAGDGNPKQPQSAPATNPPATILEHVPYSGFSGIQLYERYYGPPVSAILKPFFFASIGFSIPITRMFSGHVIWRGIVYAALMVFAKLICGLCLVRFGSFGVDLRPLKRLVVINWRTCWPRSKAEPPVQPTTLPPKTSITTGPDAGPSAQSKSDSPDERQGRWTIPKPLSLYPAAILGSAMVARGEIGFLISSVAESNGVYGDEPNELFLVVTWAILLCTLFGPITVGMLVRRVKVLQGNATGGSEYAGREDPLGVWGIVDSSPSQTEQATAIEQE